MYSFGWEITCLQRAWHWFFTQRYLYYFIKSSCRDPCGVGGVLTAGEDERAGVLVHGKVVQLKLAFCVYCQSAKKRVNVYCFATVVRHMGKYNFYVYLLAKYRKSFLLL